jgi:hypothetical protein
MKKRSAGILIALLLAVPSSVLWAEEMGGCLSWTLTFKLDVPNLDPPAIQYSVMSEDPVPVFRARVSKSRDVHKELVSREASPRQRQLNRSSLMGQTWDEGFRKVTGDQVHLLTPSPMSPKLVYYQNTPVRKWWVVTKIVHIKEKPICWYFPVEPKPDQEVEITFSESNVFDLESLYEDALKRPAQPSEADSQISR